MYHIITSSFISSVSNEFILSHIQENSSGKYTIHVFTDPDVDPDEFSDYREDFKEREWLGYQFETFAASNLKEALKMIAHEIVTVEQEMLKESEAANDTPEETNVICSCDYDSNRQVVQDLNTLLDQEGSNTTCLDIYKYLKAPSIDKLAEIICNNLHISNCHQEDPIAFSYAVLLYMTGK